MIDYDQNKALNGAHDRVSSGGSEDETKAVSCWCTRDAPQLNNANLFKGFELEVNDQHLLGRFCLFVLFFFFYKK